MTLQVDLGWPLDVLTLHVSNSLKKQSVKEHRAVWALTFAPWLSSCYYSGTSLPTCVGLCSGGDVRWTSSGGSGVRTHLGVSSGSESSGASLFPY